MNLLAKVRAWFRREPDELKRLHDAGCGNCGYITPKYPEWSMAKLDLKHHICNPRQSLSSYAVCIPKGIVITKTLDCLREDYEQAKAAYEKALVEQLSGLKDEQ